MSEGTIHLADEDSASDLDATAHKAGPGDADRLATNRLVGLAPHAPPPVPGHRPHVQAMAAPPPGVPYPPPGPSTEGSLRYRTEPPPALPRTSWWRGLIASTLAPPAATEATDGKARTRRVGAACVYFAMVLVIASLVIGLRGEPSPSSSATVSATIVITRSVLALGLLLFGYGLLKTAERLFKSAE